LVFSGGETLKIHAAEKRSSEAGRFKVSRSMFSPFQELFLPS
jgi:hypothetical protein